MNIESDIAQHLHNLGIGALGTSLFYSYIPDTDSGDFTICVLDTGGLPPDKELPTDRPTFQVFIRAKDYDIGRAKLTDVFNALHQRTGQLVPNGTFFYNIYANSHGGPIGENEAGQSEFSINFSCFIRLS